MEYLLYFHLFIFSLFSFRWRSSFRRARVIGSLLCILFEFNANTFKSEEICKSCKFQNQTHAHKLLNFELIQLELNYKGLMQARTGGGGSVGKASRWKGLQREKEVFDYERLRRDFAWKGQDRRRPRGAIPSDTTYQRASNSRNAITRTMATIRIMIRHQLGWERDECTWGFCGGARVEVASHRHRCQPKQKQ